MKSGDTVFQFPQTFNPIANVGLNVITNSGPFEQMEPRWSFNVMPAQAPVGVAAPDFTVGISSQAVGTGGSGTGSFTFSLGTGSTAAGAAIGATTGLVTATGVGTVVIKAKRLGDATYAPSSWSPDFTVTVVPDTTAPTVPTGLAASNVTTTSLTLSWAASTDAVGVTAYEVFRDGVSAGTTASTSFSLSGLTPATTYALTVRASDGGNWSAQSTPLAVTTATVDTANQAQLNTHRPN